MADAAVDRASRAGSAGEMGLRSGARSPRGAPESPRAAMRPPGRGPSRPPARGAERATGRARAGAARPGGEGRERKTPRARACILGSPPRSRRGRNFAPPSRVAAPVVESARASDGGPRAPLPSRSPPRSSSAAPARRLFSPGRARPRLRAGSSRWASTARMRVSWALRTSPITSARRWALAPSRNDSARRARDGEEGGGGGEE